MSKYSAIGKGRYCGKGPWILKDKKYLKGLCNITIYVYQSTNKRIIFCNKIILEANRDFINGIVIYYLCLSNRLQFKIVDKCDK